MLQYTFQPVFAPRVPTKETPSIVFLQYDNNSTTSIDEESNRSELKSGINEKNAVKKDIYVCTFCQVFSPHFATVSSHISVVHYESLPAGTKPENFVSRLQSLDENHQEKKAARGRPRKTQVESAVPEKPKQKIVNPVPDSEGLYWCKTCLRYFKKSRQLIQHICLGPDEQVSSEESSVELDEDIEFRTCMDVDPSPWSRIRKSKKLPENSADQSNSNSCSTEENKIVENKVIPNWRKDPRYVPLFDSEEEKAAFEEHLKSIDYSYVDDMYKIVGKQSKMKNSANSPTVIFSCNFCKKNCKSLSIIRAHCLIHTDIKPFTCPKCSYCTNSSGTLYSHMRVHTGNVYECSTCDFKCVKRSHLLDHEATHSAVYQTCKLCKNQYKTLKSLIGHIRKYHNYAGGRKYMKSLTSKRNKFACNKCNKKFKTFDILNNHNHACHEIAPISEAAIPTAENAPEQSSENINDVIADLQISDVNSVEPPAADLHCNSIPAKDPLAEMVLNNFLQQQHQSRSIMYQNVFNQASKNIISSANNNLLSNFRATKAMAERLATESSILEECQKTLDLDILKECLQNSGFSNECEEFGLIPNMSRKHSLQNDSESNSDVANHLNEISEGKLVEPKSVEIKLFEKCQRAPAYVCCVCSSIFICPSTLKAHLKEHVNSTISSFMDQAEEQQFENTPTKVAETSNELDVCEILQDSSESFSFDKELEKLYTSSLDLMYYLPEVSVVLENDAALFDSMLDDISNFPINDNPSQDLNEKVEEESVLKMFS